MAKSITVTPKKRGRGRPATGRDPVMTVRLPAKLTARIDEHAESKGESRSEVMRRFLERGLESESAADKPRRPEKRKDANERH
jgi:Arc/MetJ-type ribon-helix-helix transcriptional regulator